LKVNSVQERRLEGGTGSLVYGYTLLEACLAAFGRKSLVS